MQVWRTPRSFFATNANTASFPSRVPTITKPANDGVLDLGKEGAYVPEFMYLNFYGAGSDNDAFSVRIIKWMHTIDPIPQETLWVPNVILEVSVTLGAQAGIANSPVLDTELFADTITIVHQPLYLGADGANALSRGQVRVFSPADDTIAWIELPVYASEMLEMTCDQTTNTPTMNALYTFMDREE